MLPANISETSQATPVIANVDFHSWIDIGSILGLFAATGFGVVLSNRLEKHSKIEDKVNEHEARIGKLEVAQNWLEKLFKRE